MFRKPRERYHYTNAVSTLAISKHCSLKRYYQILKLQQQRFHDISEEDLTHEGYKVVSTRTDSSYTNKEIYSCIEEIGRVYYKVGELKIRPINQGPFGVFKHLDPLKTWKHVHLDEEENIEVYVCRYLRSVCSTFYNHLGNTKPTAPRGTDFADALILEYRII